MITIRPDCRLRAVRSLFSSCTSTNNRYVSSSSSSSSSSLFTISHDQQQQQRTERVRRSMLSVPGVDERKIKKSQQVGADCVVLDLEDGVAHHRKDEARELVRDTLTTMDPSASSSSLFGGSEVCVRINGLDTKDVAYNDLKAIMPCERLCAIVIPKVECASDIHFVTRMIDTLRVGNTNDIRIIACIESAMGFLNLHEIAKTSITSSTTTTTINASSHPHYRYHPLDALVFASEDYCSDVEAVRTKSATELLYARSQLVMTAKAYALQAIDMVHINFRDQDGLIEECDDGRRLGFTGKQAIHPDQVDIIQDRFSPSIKDVLFATKVVEAYRRTTSQGIGACVVDGIVVDLPVYKHAVKVCRRGKNMELLKNESKSK